MTSNNSPSVADQWRLVLKRDGYQHSANSRAEFDRASRYSRIWRRIFRRVRLPKAGTKRQVFELGFGGGKHLVTFALNNWICAGIDCSEEVRDRARNYIADLSRFDDRPSMISLILGDFLAYSPAENAAKFDLVYHVGVVEHFFDSREREAVVRKMFDLARPGGYVVSIVPNGTHPMRIRVQEEGLGGYDSLIPEINYTPSLIREELARCGGESVIVMPHNLFNHVLLDESSNVPATFLRAYYYAWQIIPPGLLPHRFACRHGEVLVGIARKPA